MRNREPAGQTVSATGPSTMQSFILKQSDSQPWMMVIPKMLNINVKRHSGKKTYVIQKCLLEINDRLFDYFQTFDVLMNTLEYDLKKQGNLTDINEKN